MNFFADMAQGMIAQQDANQRKRGELARAFQEFRSANPHATLQEMQQYIDAQSGGRNYLSRGAPSGDVLRSIADGNAKAKAQADTNARLAQMQEQSRVMDMINSAAERALLDNNGNISAAQEAVRKQMGGDFGTIDPTSIFTNERWQRIQQGEIAKNYDHAKAWIYDSVDDKGEITVTPKDVSKYFGVPEAVAEGILYRAKDDRKKEGDRLRAEREKEMRQTRQQALAFVVGELEKDPTRKPEDVVGYFYGVDPSELPADFMQAIRTDTQRELDRKEEIYKRETDTAISQGKRDLMAALNTDQDIRAALMAGDQAAAVQGMLAYAETFPPEIKAQLTGTWLDQQIARTIASMQQTQRLEVRQRRDTLAGEAQKYGDEVKERSAQAVADAIEADLIVNPAVAAAAASLAGQYAITMEHLPMLNQLGVTDPKAEPAAVQKAVKDLLDNAGVPKLSDAVKDAQEGYMRTRGGVESPMTFQEWEQSVASDVTEDRATIDQYVQQVAALPDPAERAAKLEQLKATVVATHDRFAKNVAADEQNAISILLYGTTPWDKGRAAQQVNAHQLMAEAAIKKIEALRVSAERQATSLANRQVNLGGPAPNPQASPARNAITGAVGGQLGENAVSAVAADYANMPWSFFTMTDDQYQANRYMGEFVNQARGRLGADPALLAQFQADPWSFIRNSQQDWIGEIRNGLGPVPGYYP